MSRVIEIKHHIINLDENNIESKMKEHIEELIEEIKRLNYPHITITTKIRQMSKTELDMQMLIQGDDNLDNLNA